MVYKIRWPEIFTYFLTGSLSFIIRFAIWIYPGYGWGRLAIYDVTIYTLYGREFVKAFLKRDFLKMASIKFGGPPLGIFLIGLSSYAFKSIIDKYKAGLLAPIALSSLTVLLIHLILRKCFKLSAKYAILGSLIPSFDPYLIQFSAAYLDPIGAFFVFLATYIYFRFKDHSVKRYILVGLLMGLSILTKFSFFLFVLFFAMLLSFMEREHQAGLVIFLSAISLTPLIPWIWFGETLNEKIARNLAFNSILPPILFGPIMIDIPESYPWYILTYFGMGQIQWNVLPSTSHFLLFCAIIYRSLRRDLRINRRMMTFLLASILMMVFMPRNYWTTTWGGGVIKGENVLLKQFYPYYFYLTNLVAGLATCDLLFVRSSFSDVKYLTASFSAVVVYCLTAPFTLIMNGLYPYWDFIFTLIFNFSKGNPIMEHYGLLAFIVTLVMLLALIIFATLILRRTGSLSK